MRGILALAAVLALAPLSFAASPLSGMQAAIVDLCKALACMLPVAAMLMIILAGVIYATGQMMGAETRARANVWATAALTGALIAILIAVIAPAVLSQIYDPASTTGLTNQCQCST
jgi:hypothetical protein